MCQDYSAAALLIEFTADRAFLLQSASDIKEQMELNNICSKMALLAIAFPAALFLLFLLFALAFHLPAPWASESKRSNECLAALITAIGSYGFLEGIERNEGKGSHSAPKMCVDPVEFFLGDKTIRDA